MAILAGHVRWYEEIFAIPGVLQEPIAMLGFQEIGIHPACFIQPPGKPFNRLRSWLARRASAMPEILNQEFRVPSLLHLLENRGLREVRIIDPHDPRSDIKHNMNHALPSAAWESCQTFLDIGSLEHVFDTRTCIENALRMIRVGGFYFLHTCVNGFLRHGLHTFNHQGLIDALELNGFRVEYLRFTTADGVALSDPGEAENSVVWILARKERKLQEFRCPEQRGWQDVYVAAHPPVQKREWLARLKGWVAWILPPAAMEFYRLLRGDRRTRLVARGIGEAGLEDGIRGRR